MRNRRPRTDDASARVWGKAKQPVFTHGPTASLFVKPTDQWLNCNVNCCRVNSLACHELRYRGIPKPCVVSRISNDHSERRGVRDDAMPIAEYFAASALIVLITLAVVALVKDF